MISVKTALSSMASASSFFSRAFSSSSTFNRLAPDTSMPPYLAFHLLGLVGARHPRRHFWSRFGQSSCPVHAFSRSSAQ